MPKKRKRTRPREGQGGDVLGLETAECEAEAGVDSVALDRALELLARWAQRRGEKVLVEAGGELGNLVTGCNIKGYGGNNGSN